MQPRESLRTALRTAAVTAAGGALVVGLAGAAYAGGGEYVAMTKDSKACGWADGTYYYSQTGTISGKKSYDTNWNFYVKDYCAGDGKGVSLYTKYNKWDSSRRQWVSYTSSYHRIKSSGTGHNVADVRIYVCIVGYAKTCAIIEPAA